MFGAKPPRKVYGKVYGWRTWGLAVWNPNQAPMLKGQFGQLWHGPQMDATHVGDQPRRFAATGKELGPHKEADVPHKDCKCGIWVQRVETGIDTRAWTLYRSINIQGYVEIWGKGFEGPLGYRVKHAKIIGPLTVELRCCQKGTPVMDPDGVVRAPPCDEPVERIHKTGANYIAFCAEHIPTSYPLVTPQRYFPADSGTRIYDLKEFTNEVLSDMQKRYGCEIWLWEQLLED